MSKLFGTSDGFLFERKQDALSHNTTLEGNEIEVFKPKGEKETETKSAFLQLSVKDIEVALVEMTDVDELNTYLKEENALEQPRSTAIKAIEGRIELLESPE